MLVERWRGGAEVAAKGDGSYLAIATCFKLLSKLLTLKTILP